MSQHTFASTGEAYDASQCRDDIKDGDVLLVPSEGVAGFLYAAWPVAVTEVTGHLHGLSIPLEEWLAGSDDDGPRSWYATSVELAKVAATTFPTGNRP